MKIIYTAGPYRGKSESAVKANIDKAEKVAIRLWRKGYCCICPHKNTAFFGGILPDIAWLLGDLELIKRVDALCMIPGWERSEGANIELMLAKKCGIKVYYREKDVPNLNRDNKRFQESIDDLKKEIKEEGK